MMEQNRVLWIVGAVGAFLLVVVGAALLLYSPSRNPAASMSSIQNLDSTWVSPQILPEPQALPSQTLNALPLVDASKPNPGTTPLTNEQQTAQNTVPNSIQSLNVYTGQATLYSGQTTIDLNDITKVSGNGLQTQTPAASQSVQNPPAQTGTVAGTTGTDTTAAPPLAKTVQTTTSSTKPTAVTSTSSAKTTAKTPAASTGTTKANTASQAVSDKYWIQAASFTSKKNAEELRVELSAEKINSEIFTFTNDKAVMFYRVRVGPYSTKSEAEYWQTRIALIDRLSTAQTYITNSSAPKN